MFALVTYGLLPRLLLLALAAVRLRAATGALLLEDARVTALLDRMASPAIETAAAQHEEAPAPEIGLAAAAIEPMTGSARALIWENSLPADAARDYARRHLGLEVLDVAEAGAGQLDADRAALEQLASDRGRNADRLHAGVGTAAARASRFSRGAAPAHRPGRVSIVVAPVPDGPRAVTEVERATWQRAIAQLADPEDLRRDGRRMKRAALRHRRPSEQGQEQHRRHARRGRCGRDLAASRHHRRRRARTRCGSTARCSTSSSTRPAFSARAKRSHGSKRTTAARANAAAVVAEFSQAHASDPRFHDECELLAADRRGRRNSLRRRRQPPVRPAVRSRDGNPALDRAGRAWR